MESREQPRGMGAPIKSDVRRDSAGSGGGLGGAKGGKGQRGVQKAQAPWHLGLAPR